MLARIKNPKIRAIIETMLEHDENDRYGYSQILQTFFT